MKKVKCINTETSEFVIGKIYNVVNEDETHYYFDNDNCYPKINFVKLNTPTHYQTKIQPIEFIEANNLGFHEGNVIKYITRYKEKNGIEDLEKAKTYIEMLIDKLKRENV